MLTRVVSHWTSPFFIHLLTAKGRIIAAFHIGCSTTVHHKAHSILKIGKYCYLLTDVEILMQRYLNILVKIEVK